MKPVDLIIIAVIAAAVALAIFFIVRNKKRGKSSCGCDCENCPGCDKMSGIQHSNGKQTDK